MESLLEKISSYIILNNLIPGAVFVFLGKLLDIISLPLDGIVESIFVYVLIDLTQPSTKSCAEVRSIGHLI